MVGSQSMIMNIYRNIDRSKVQFDFIVMHKDELLYANEINQLGGKIYFLPQYKIYNHVSFTKEWNCFFKKHPEYKVIHGHVRSSAAIYLKIAKKNKLYTIAHSHSISSGKEISSIVKNILQHRIRYVADYFMGCSYEANRWLFGEKITKSNRCLVLNNGINVEEFKFDKDVRKRYRKILDIQEEDIVIGHVGRFAKEKNHKFIFKVFSELYKENNKYKLLLLGDGQEKNKIIRKNKNKKYYKNIIFAGTVNNVNDYMQAMDIFILPSKYEGLGMVLIEAQANGLKCLASTNVPQEVNISKSIIFKKLNVQLWKDTIIELNINRNIINKEIIMEEYDIAHIAKKMEQIYCNIIESK